MTVIEDTESTAQRLREDLVDLLVREDAIHTAAVEQAVRTLPRGLFLPGVPLTVVYANDVVSVKEKSDGVSISAASQPMIVTMQLEQLGLQSGHRVFEAGAATGINAAYMALIVGPDGHVTTTDVDADLVEGAREHLAAAGITNVDVLLQDGALGHAAGAPFDRIIATVGVHTVPGGWLQQLAPGGRIVAPVRLRGGATRSICFERGDGGWISTGSELCGFMPLRGGNGDDTRHHVPLTADGDITLQTHKDQTIDTDALAGVFHTPRTEIWTGSIIPGHTSYEWLYLWLALSLPNSLSSMSIRPSAKDSGVAVPMLKGTSMTTTRGGSLAYLAIRPSTTFTNGWQDYETGVFGNGPAAAELAEEVAEQILIWDSTFRGRSVRFEIPDTPTVSDPAAGRFVLHRPLHSISVIWE